MICWGSLCMGMLAACDCMSVARDSRRRRLLFFSLDSSFRLNMAFVFGNTIARDIACYTKQSTTAQQVATKQERPGEASNAEGMGRSILDSITGSERKGLRDNPHNAKEVRLVNMRKEVRGLGTRRSGVSHSRRSGIHLSRADCRRQIKSRPSEIPHVHAFLPSLPPCTSASSLYLLAVDRVRGLGAPGLDEVLAAFRALLCGITFGGHVRFSPETFASFTWGR